jgi:hypothetical protein
VNPDSDKKRFPRFPAVTPFSHNEKHLTKRGTIPEYGKRFFDFHRRNRFERLFHPVEK